MAHAKDGREDAEEQLGLRKLSEDQLGSPQVIDPATFFPLSIRDGKAYLSDTQLASFSLDDTGETVKVLIEYWKPE